MFDIQNVRAKARWHRILVNKMIRLEPWLRRQMRVILSEQVERAAVLIEQGHTRIDLIFTTTDVARLGAALGKQYKTTALVFSTLVFRELAKLKATEPRQTKATADEFWRTFNRWSQTQAAAKAVGLNEVTKRIIGRYIRIGQQNGMSYGETAKLVRKKVSGLSKVRAARIARTEVHTASVLSTDKAVEATRLKFEREWSAVLDERTRERHAKANGQRRGQNEVFNVGGDKLMYPGDPRGRAGNVINCRCVLLYHRIKSFQRRAT